MPPGYDPVGTLYRANRPVVSQGSVEPLCVDRKHVLDVRIRHRYLCGAGRPVIKNSVSREGKLDHSLLSYHTPTGVSASSLAPGYERVQNGRPTCPAQGLLCVWIRPRWTGFDVEFRRRIAAVRWLRKWRQVAVALHHGNRLTIRQSAAFGQPSGVYRGQSGRSKCPPPRGAHINQAYRCNLHII
jgi:hypothetical protein